jgi:hypothetical protein
MKPTGKSASGAIARGGLALAVLAGGLSCGDARTGPDESDAGATSACGTPNASTACESTTWPRLVIAFADPAAASFAYSFRDGSGAVSSERNECPSGSSLRCDLGFYGDPSESLDVTILVGPADGGPALSSDDVRLEPFNYCGNGVAQVYASTDDAGMPTLSEVQYVDACGSL